MRIEGASLLLEEYLMTNLPFQEFTKRLEKELYRLHYTESSVIQYRRMWRRIATFFEQEGIDHFTEEAGMHFLDEQFNFFELAKAAKLTQSTINVFRVVRMRGDFQQHGSILRRYYKQKERLQTNDLKKLLQGYQNHCQQSEYAQVTQHYRKMGREAAPESPGHALVERL
jgi:integrase/recombinase XerD